MVDLYDAAQVYNHANPGIGMGRAAPSATEIQHLMATAHHYTAQSEWPLAYLYGGGYWHQIEAKLEQVSPDAKILVQGMLQAPDCQPLVKNMEFGFAALAERSPETWEHLKHHAALTMMAFKHLHGDIRSQPEAALQALVGALGHDIGKMAIDPKLLHKGTRLAPLRFEQAVATYASRVPDYPQKAHDLQFLQEAQKGNIVFSQDDISASMVMDEVVPLTTGHRSETHWLTPEGRKLHNKIMGRIDRLARRHIPDAAQGAWLNSAEIRQLASDVHGTLTLTERKAMASHDAMGSEFFAQQSLPALFAHLPQMVNMEVKAANADAAKIQSLIKLTDTFEALTADRSYRAGYSAVEALQTMDAMARRGVIDPALFTRFTQSGVWKDYAQAFGKPVGEVRAVQETQPSPPLHQASLSGWAERMAMRRAQPAAHSIP